MAISTLPGRVPAGLVVASFPYTSGDAPIGAAVTGVDGGTS